jgi:hypothetical protein
LWFSIIELDNTQTSLTFKVKQLLIIRNALYSQSPPSLPLQIKVSLSLTKGGEEVSVPRTNLNMSPQHLKKKKKKKSGSNNTKHGDPPNHVLPTIS